MRAVADAGCDASRWEIDSAGTGDWHVGDLPDKRMRIHARRRGLELIHRCRQVRVADFDDFDIIVGMAEFVGKAMRYDYIPDPYYEGAEGFELVLDLLDDGCRNLYRLLGGC